FQTGGRCFTSSTRSLHAAKATPRVRRGNGCGQSDIANFQRPDPVTHRDGDDAIGRRYGLGDLAFRAVDARRGMLPRPSRATMIAPGELVARVVQHAVEHGPRRSAPSWPTTTPPRATW